MTEQTEDSVDRLSGESKTKHEENTVLELGRMDGEGPPNYQAGPEAKVMQEVAENKKVEDVGPELVRPVSEDTYCSNDDAAALGSDVARERRDSDSTMVGVGPTASVLCERNIVLSPCDSRHIQCVVNEAPIVIAPQVLGRTQSESAKRRNKKQSKRRNKTDVDVPAALKSLRRRPRSGFPQRPSIISRRGVYPQRMDSSEASGGHRSREDWWVTSGSQQTSTDDSISGTHAGVFPTSLVDIANHEMLSQSPSFSEQDWQTRALPSAADESELCLRLHGTVISSDDVSDTPHGDRRSRSVHSSSSVSSRDSMHPVCSQPESPITPDISSPLQYAPNAPPRDVGSPTNIFRTSSSSPTGYGTFQPPNQFGPTGGSTFVFPENLVSQGASIGATASTSATLPCSRVQPSSSGVIIPPQSSASMGRMNPSNLRLKDYSDVPAALMSLRRKPRSGFKPRSSRMQVGPQVFQEVTRATNGAHVQAEHVNCDNLTAQVRPSENRRSGPRPHGVHLTSENRVEPQLAEPVVDQAVTLQPQSAQSGAQVPEALQSLRRHPRSGFRQRASVHESSLFVTANLSDPKLPAPDDLQSAGVVPAGASMVSGATSSNPETMAFCAGGVASTTSGVPLRSSRSTSLPRDHRAADRTSVVILTEGNEHVGRTEVVISRRPARSTGGRNSPPPAYDDTFFYPVGDVDGEVILPDLNNPAPKLPSYDDVLRLSQESPPPYMGPEFDGEDGS